MLLSPTFRDPDGFCLAFADRFFRFINPESAERVRSLVSSNVIRCLTAERLVPETRVLAQEEVAALLENEEFQSKLQIGRDALVLEHEFIHFASYPHEWCPEMLHAAGELTLQIQLRALEEGMTLKDATPTNILFRGHKPVFVDFLSFVPRPEGMVVWAAYAQFVRTFLLPLLLHYRQGLGTHEFFIGHRDGLEPEEVYAQMPFFSRFAPTVLRYVALPTWLGRHRSARDAAPETAKRYDKERAFLISRMLVQGLQGALRKLRPQSLRVSTWSNYTTNSNYEGGAFAVKEDFVKGALNEMLPNTVLDVGCDTGHFSCIAASLGASVTALDYDSVVVGRLWNRSRKENLRVLPLVMNLARPSPGLGWRNRENASFLSRAARRFDVALLLAVIHHLTVTEGIPLDDLFRQMAEIVNKGLIVEYVPPSDTMFRQIVRNKEHLVPKLQQASFESAFTPWFEQARRESLPESGRTLYCLRKKRRSDLDLRI